MHVFQANDSDDLTRIKEFAARFRHAIEKCDTNSLPAHIKKFPYQACCDACLLLARYLKENRCGEFELVNGEPRVSGSRSGHFWLQRGKVVVDITADQFGSQYEAVIVGYGGGLHSEFDVIEVKSCNWSTFDPLTLKHLSTTYDAIISHLEA